MPGDGYKYKFLNKEYEDSFALNVTETDFRHYDSALGRFNVLDPMAELAPDFTPYRYGFNNPVFWQDATGLFETEAQARAFALDNGIGNYKLEYDRQSKGYTLTIIGGEFDGRSFYDFTELLPEVLVGSDGDGSGGGGNGKNGDSCQSCVDPSTIGKNLLGLTYPGGDNPRSYNGEYNYSYVPKKKSEYPAIGHDRRYDKLKIEGASGLLTDTRAIGADWRFVWEELVVAAHPLSSPSDKASAGLLGVGLGIAALPKTIYQLKSSSGFLPIILWYNVSNQGVNNTPTPHKH
ncbi:RHS repeat-associated core domain-containing protein [Paenimyroides ummariense]|uniref:RHS repeat-associated core domain-containing protein n=1 Tax=Paenimyroides ummariense TaxID=913024 RepID=A0A1I5GSM0_9FLAO|nr:RHS repeat-associated core domain-containing protein [Paenimyroides ummariense]